MLQMAVTKISTFLYIKIFIVSSGLFISYLILECLFTFTYDLLYFGYTLLHSWEAYNTFEHAQDCKYKICPFEYFFGSILRDCSWNICFFMFTYNLLYFYNNFPHSHRGVTTGGAAPPPLSNNFVVAMRSGIFR